LSAAVESCGCRFISATVANAVADSARAKSTANSSASAAFRLEQLATARDAAEARDAFADVDQAVRRLLPALSQFVSEIAGNR
jgi:hypothetical protein